MVLSCGTWKFYFSRCVLRQLEKEQRLKQKILKKLRKIKKKYQIKNRNEVHSIFYVDYNGNIHKI